MTPSGPSPHLTRRQFLVGGAGVALAVSAGGYGLSQLLADPASTEVVLRPQTETVEIGRRQVTTWTFGDGIPGAEIRLKQGQKLRVRVENDLPVPTTIHWHGIRVPNAMDGVPGMTQPAIQPGGSFVYEFAPPDAGTYWFHPHVGTQLDRGLYAPLIVEPSHEPLAFDRDVTIVLDDWLDGLGRTPPQVLRDLQIHGMQMGGAGSSGGMAGMAGMNMGGLGSLTGVDLGAVGDGSIVVAGDAADLAGSDPVSGTLPALVNLLKSGDADAGDVTYPLFLINGRPPDDPYALQVRRGERVRLRLLNAAADTHFVFSIDDHPVTIVATDGQPVSPVKSDGVVVGMGERVDVLLDATKPGAYRLLAAPLGKKGRAVGVLRYTDAARSVAPAASAPARIPLRVASYSDLKALDHTPVAATPREISLDLTMDMSQPYRWLMGGQAFSHADSIRLDRGEPVRFTIRNRTMMPHPMHLHGHFFTLETLGPRKDTVIVPPQGTAHLNLVADNPGMWMIHCHNLYHALAGMMRVIEVM
ncbi:MAG: multicopper oxidase family protein [Actinomycetes bacterium]